MIYSNQSNSHGQYYKKHEIQRIVEHNIKNYLWNNGVEYQGTKLNNAIEKITKNFLEYHARNQNGNPHLYLTEGELEELREECCNQLSQRMVDINQAPNFKRRSNVWKNTSALINRAKSQCGIPFFCYV